MRTTQSSLDRLLNPERLALPLGRLRLNPVGLLMLGVIFYLTAAAGWATLLITFAVIAVLYGWPLWELNRARRGKYSWMYRELALERVQQAVSKGQLGFSEPEREVVAYLAGQSSQLSDQFSIEMLLQNERPPFISSEGREARKQAIEQLLERGLAKRSKGCAEVISLELKSLVTLT